MTQFTITELGKFKGNVSAPQISGNNVVWRSENSDENKIFFYDGNKTLEISNTKGSNPRISGNNVVWSGADSDGDKEIFLYNGKETIQLTDNNVDDTSPQIYRDKIVWTIDTAEGITIFLDNGQDIIQLNESNSSNSFPKIFGDNVVWTARDSDEKEELFLYNGKETIQISQDKHRHIYRFQVSEDKVVWTARDFKGKKQIFLYNGRETIQIYENNSVNNSSFKAESRKAIWKNKLSGFDSEIFFNTKKLIEFARLYNPLFGDEDDLELQISGDYVVWKSRRNLYLYDGRKIIQLDDRDRNVIISSIQISDKNKNIVWVASNSIDSGIFAHDRSSEIFLYNGKETIQLTNNDVIDYAPQISGDSVVWVSGGSLNSEIFFYNGNKIIQITNNSTGDVLPYIEENKIVWLNEDESITSVMLTTIDNTESTSIPSSDRNYKIITSSTIIILCLISLCFLKKLLLNEPHT